VQTGPVQSCTPRARLTRLLAAATVLAASVAAVACSAGPARHPAASATGPGGSGTTGTTPAGGTGRSTNWLQYHGNARRTGTVAGLPAAGRLSVAWSRKLGAAVYGQPLVIGNTVIAATESDQVYALNRATGAVRWHRRIGSPLPLPDQPCGDINPLGITSTPAYDQATGLVYVVAQNGTRGHVIAGLTLSGRVKIRVSLPAFDHEPAYDQQRGALAIGNGYVYVVFGGHYGDCGPYVGTVEAFPVGGVGRIFDYLVPTAKQGGIWASGGPVIGADGTVYVSTGNGVPGATRFDGSDSVTALTPRLHEAGIFAPTDWRMLSADDLDLGSMSPALLSDGQILQVGKSSTGYLLTAAHLGGVGGQVATGHVCAAFGGAAVSGDIVYVPCTSGLAAVDTAHNRVSVRWRGPSLAWGSPVVGGGAVWVASPFNGILYELATASGHVQAQIKVASELPHFVSPSLSGRLILIGTMTGVVAVSGA
jgi:outer membrane protein assembly factor BamB